MKSKEDISFTMKNSADLDFSINNVQKNTTHSKEKIRQIFDNISLNVISFLEKHRGVTDVKFFERPPVTQSQINEWEKKYYPCKLPDDYKAFLFVSDGFVLKWHMKYNREILPLGHMSLSPLHSLKPVQFGTDNDSILAFHLDYNSNRTDGRVAFVFNNSANNEENPSVWFEDLSTEWIFVCNSFSDYFRLMIMHLGLTNWQYAFTKVGLNPITMQWLRFLVPNRLDIDLRHNANGIGWILPKPNKHKKSNEVKIKRKKLSLSKIDQIVVAQASKGNKAKTKLNNLSSNRRPGSAPNRNK